MNAVVMLSAVAAIGLVLVVVVGVIVRKTLGSTPIAASLRDEDRKEIVEMKAFLDTLRRERKEDRDEQAKREGRLEKQIEGLGRQAMELDESTIGLERALRGDAQLTGSWGEMQLKKVLDLSGLTEGISYSYQETFAGEDSARRNLRTDIQVKLPNDKVIVIDSKNTTPSYLDYTAAEDESDRERESARIIDSVRHHMDEIITAKYQKSIKNCYPKVIMYFPFEVPYLLACKAQIKVGSEKQPLREYAYRNDIIFATASNLLPILEGVAMIWAEQNLDKTIEKFLSDADKLCAKANTFLATYRKIGKMIGDLGDAYREGMGQLAEGNGNLVKKLSDLSEANVESANKLPSPEVLMEHAEKTVGARAQKQG